MTTKQFKEEMIVLGLERVNDTNMPRELILVAEGDSWFNYHVQKDVIDYLIKMGYAIDKNGSNLAKVGDTLENMVYGTKYNLDCKKRIVKNASNISLDETISTIYKYKPKFVLFSAGGNNVVGEELINYLNHKKSGDALFREDVFRTYVNGPIKSAIKHFIREVTKARSDIQILMDGYDYPIPNGKGIRLLGIKFLVLGF